MAVLIIMSGERKGERLDILRKRVGVGRADDNLLMLDDASVSGHHCEIVREGDVYTLRDLGSTNGTTLNGAPVREGTLKPRDLIAAGGIEFMIDGNDMAFEDTPEEPSEAGNDPGMAVSRESQGRISTAFGTKRDARSIWFALIGLLIVLALGAMGWFLYSLFSG